MKFACESGHSTWSEYPPVKVDAPLDRGRFFLPSFLILQKKTLDGIEFFFLLKLFLLCRKDQFISFFSDSYQTSAFYLPLNNLQGKLIQKIGL